MINVMQIIARTIIICLRNHVIRRASKIFYFRRSLALGVYIQYHLALPFDPLFTAPSIRIEGVRVRIESEINYSRPYTYGDRAIRLECDYDTRC